MVDPSSMLQAIIHAAMTLMYHKKVHASDFFLKSLGNVSIVYICLVRQPHHDNQWVKSDPFLTFHMQFHEVQAQYINIQNGSAAACR